MQRGFAPSTMIFGSSYTCFWNISVNTVNSDHLSWKLIVECLQVGYGTKGTDNQKEPVSIDLTSDDEEDAASVNKVKDKDTGGKSFETQG